MIILKNIIKTLFITALLTFFFLVLISTVRADEFHLIELNELTIDYKDYKIINPESRSLLIYPEVPKESMNLNVNLDIINYVYWNSTIETLTTDAQYRGIGLETRLGVKLLPKVDLGLYHHSQHVLDGQQSFMWKFPEEDALEIRIHVFSKHKEDSLLGDFF